MDIPKSIFNVLFLSQKSQNQDLDVLLLGNRPTKISIEH